MEKLGMDLEEGAPGDAKPVNPQEARKLAIQRCMQSLLHGCQCRDANCRLPSCLKVRFVLMHLKICKTQRECSTCKHFIALCCYHAKNCPESSKCCVPFCGGIKKKMVQHRVQRLRELLRRRMAAMNPRGAAPPA